ncbi:hypothetical protein ATANTOWER_013228 [Ataeniobius toweri]|uniref:Secreted protein n=1 Tax=Ataeniobius toweri TaxID=208326 RepID=A0ABU7CIP6_9TELE|nr:hypothetical protein [Ataeniobius toweri]
MVDLAQLVLVLVFCFIWDQVAGAADSVETPRRPSPQTPPPAPPGGAQGVPRPAERHSPSSMSWAVSWAVPCASSRWDMPGTPPEEGIQEAYGICPSHLNWLLSMWRSSGSTPSSSRMSKLLTLSLGECPATLRRKLILARS